MCLTRFVALDYAARKLLVICTLEGNEPCIQRHLISVEFQRLPPREEFMHLPIDRMSSQSQINQRSFPQAQDIEPPLLKFELERKYE